MYDNISKISQSLTGSFINYNWLKYLYGKDDFILYEDQHDLNKTYYFVIRNKDDLKDDLELILTIYSTATLTNITNSIQGYLYHYNNKNDSAYKFQIPLEHKRYLLIGYYTSNENLPANYIIYENGETLIYNNSIINKENYIELKPNSNYIIYFKLIPLKSYGLAYLFMPNQHIIDIYPLK